MPGGHAGHGGAHTGHDGSGISSEVRGKTWVDSISDEEKAAVKTYAEDGFIRINEALRTGGDPEPETALIDKAMKPLASEMIVYRGGIDSGVGKVFQDKGFTSTTMDKNLLANSAYDAIWEIKVPAGTGVSYVNHAAGNVGTRMDEKELLLRRGLKYRIVRRERVGGKIRIFAEVTGKIDQSVKVDLDKWLRKSIKSMKAGKSPAVEFESNYIPNEMKSEILIGLKSATTEEDVRKSFNGHLQGEKA